MDGLEQKNTLARRAGILKPTDCPAGPLQKAARAHDAVLIRQCRTALAPTRTAFHFHAVQFKERAMAGECKVDPRFVASLSGCWAFRGQGTDGTQPAAGVGYFYFNAGQVTGFYSGMHGGTPVSRTFQRGTVTLNSDGSGRISVWYSAAKVPPVVPDPPDEILDFVTASGGTLMYLVHKRNGTTVTSEARKI